MDHYAESWELGADGYVIRDVCVNLWSMRIESYSSSISPCAGKISREKVIQGMFDALCLEISSCAS